jgi:tetratricopeptide (TPR) repeat protein
MRNRRSFRWMLALALASSAARAGETDVDQARAIFNAGAQAYEKADYASALEAFEAAYRITPRPGILFSMAQAHRRQYAVSEEPLHLREAVRLYREYLDKVNQGERRADAVQALVELEPLVARLAADGSAPVPTTAAAPRTRLMVSVDGDAAVLSLDGHATQGAPLIADVAPGRHRIRASAPGYVDEVRDVVAVEGALVAIDVPLREQPGKLLVVAPPGADVSVDRRLAGTAPLPGPISVAPGRRYLWIAKAGSEPREVVVDVGRGQSRTVRVELSRTDQRVAAELFFVGAGAGLLAGGVFTGLALENQSKASDVRSRQSTGDISMSAVHDYEGARQRRDDFRTAAYAAFGSAAGLGAIGAVLYFADRPPTAPVRAERPEPGGRKARPELGLVPLWAPSVSGLAVHGRF